MILVLSPVTNVVPERHRAGCFEARCGGFSIKGWGGGVTKGM